MERDVRWLLLPPSARARRGPGEAPHGCERVSVLVERGDERLGDGDGCIQGMVRLSSHIPRFAWERQLSPSVGL